MEDTSRSVVISGRVRLARNYHDLPFPNRLSPEGAALCRGRASEAMLGGADGYYILRMKELPEPERMRLMEEHLISRDLLQSVEEGAAIVRGDGRVSVMVNEEDHLRIQAITQGFDLPCAAAEALRAEEKLSGVCAFSFDKRLGYLTACPTNTGTGMRASLMMHLPMLTRLKQMGTVNQSVAKLGLTMRGIYGEGSEALGDLYQVSNEVTLGRTEEELTEAVAAVGRQLMSMENALRETTLAKQTDEFGDVVMRSYGIMRYAVRMGEDEFMKHWSNIRMGAACGLISAPLEKLDELLTSAQSAHALAGAEASEDVDVARSRIIKRNLDEMSQEV